MLGEKKTSKNKTLSDIWGVPAVEENKRMAAGPLNEGNNMCWVNKGRQKKTASYANTHHEWHFFVDLFWR